MDDNELENVSGPKIDRRTTMKLLSAAGMSGLAGCLGGGGNNSSSGTAGSSPAANNSSNSEGSGNSSQSQQSSNIKTGGRLKAGWFTGSIDQLDPPKIPVAIYFQVASNIFNGLVSLKKDLTIQGDLAKDWEVTKEGSRFIFNLRKDAVFHNGNKFTAEDVKYSISRTINEELAAATKLSTLKDPSKDGVVVQDDYTVELNFERAMAPALVYLTRGPGRAATIVSKEAIENMGAKQYGLTPVGTGAFEVTEHEVGDHITLDAFDDYFATDENGNNLPYLDGVDIQTIPEAATITNAIQAGDIDFAQEVPLQNVDRVEKSSNAQKLAAPGINWSGLAMNNQREPFTSKQARLGIAKALNAEELVETAYFGNAIADKGPLNKATEWVWREDKPDDQEYDPEKAKQLLSESGAEGAEFSILSQGGEGSLRASKVVRQQLNKLNLNVTLEQVTSGTYWDRVYASDFDTTLVGSAGDPDPDQSLYNFLRSYEKDGVWNFSKYKNSKVGELLKKQRRQLDREKRKETLWEIENMAIADAPWAFLTHTDDVAAKQSHVKGFTHIPFMRNFHTVWLDN